MNILNLSKLPQMSILIAILLGVSHCAKNSPESGSSVKGTNQARTYSIADLDPRDIFRTRYAVETAGPTVKEMVEFPDFKNNPPQVDKWATEFYDSHCGLHPKLEGKTRESAEGQVCWQTLANAYNSCFFELGLEQISAERGVEAVRNWFKELQLTKDSRWRLCVFSILLKEFPYADLSKKETKKKKKDNDEDDCADGAGSNCDQYEPNPVGSNTEPPPPAAEEEEEIDEDLKNAAEEVEEEQNSTQDKPEKKLCGAIKAAVQGCD